MSNKASVAKWSVCLEAIVLVSPNPISCEPDIRDDQTAFLFLCEAFRVGEHSFEYQISPTLDSIAQKFKLGKRKHTNKYRRSLIQN